MVTSPDIRVAEYVAEHVEEVTKRRVSKDPSIQEVGAYLSGEDEGVFREAQGTGIVSVWWRVGTPQSDLVSSGRPLDRTRRYSNGGKAKTGSHEDCTRHSSAQTK